VVKNPSLIVVEGVKQGHDRFKEGLETPASDLYADTRFVFAVDGDDVRTFDAHLKPLFTLTGFSKPKGVTTDWSGRIYVADSGNNRLVRFLGDGQLDTSFGEQGYFKGTAELPLSNPRTIYALNEHDRDGVMVPAIEILHGVAELISCTFVPVECGKVTTRFDPKLGALLSYSAPGGSISSGYPTLLRFENALGLNTGMGMGTPSLSVVLNAPQKTLAAIFRDWLMGGWIAVDQSGKTFEGCHFGDSIYGVPFSTPLTALATDPFATYKLNLGAEGHVCLRPLVVYVGTSGKLERRRLR